MDDLIERLKRQEAQTEQSAQRATTQAAIRLHNAKIVNAKLPTFWAATVASVEHLQSELRKQFPSKKRWHCHLNKQFDGAFVLSREGLPRLELLVECNADGQCLDLTERQKTDFIRPAAECGRGQINITANEDEELEFRYNGVAHNTPESLAEAFVSRVISDQ
jgi:hypothetical protein